ncbi:hypothetical protein EJ02DRAFT_441137 [Clathrospora elynae]|uniref:Uncharacterized protein n=1 Tax=Clathrospora elynae TaxID=706981 RepID=A0A6A5T493_9PLEO|nr:hypothetical protein EJ02DRAFT_441137 [Clathrospora elynae]
MRRPPIACRRAVQSLQSSAPQHIWIPDELLAVAFNRVFRASCPHQTRHGSHVPGPLEARRRATKRRMTVSANFYPQDSFPSSFSLGALFGLRKDPQPTWRYEPPSQQHNVQPLDISLNISSPPASRRSLPPPVEPTASPRNLHSYGAPCSFSQNVAQTVPQEQNLGTPESFTEYITVPASGAVAAGQGVDIEAHFEDFKSRIAHAGHLSGAGRSRLLAEAFSLSRPAHGNAWVYNVMVVKHLTDLNWDPVRILAKLKSFAVPPMYAAESLELLRCLEKLSVRFPQSSRVYLRVHMRLAEAAACVEASTSTSQDLGLLLMVQQLWQLAHSQNTHVKQSVVDALCAVASKIQERNIQGPLYSILADVSKAEHRITLLLVRATKNSRLRPALEQVLICLPRERLRSLVPSITLHLTKAAEWRSRLLETTYKHRLTLWLTVLQNVDARLGPGLADANLLDTAVAGIVEHVFTNCNASQIRPYLLLHALVFKLTQRRPAYAASKERLLQLIDSSAISALDERSPVRLETALALIFSLMRKSSLPYRELASMTSNALTWYAHLGSVHRFLTALMQQEIALHDTSKIHNLIIGELDHLRQRTGRLTEEHRQHTAKELRTCYDILKLLNRLTVSYARNSTVVEQRTILASQDQRQFQAILDRAQENQALPHVYRNLTADMLVEKRNMLIHQLAHHYSLDTTRTHRENWRAIYYLYSYARHHALPLGPLFTKAVVRISISRPLSENRFVSARRLIWVCRLVARVEGEDVAKKVESTLWQWRGDLIKHAKNVYVGVGGDHRARAHIGTMKRLGLI